MQFNLRVGKIPWSRKWQPTPVILPEKSHGQRTLASYSPRGCKESIQLSTWAELDFKVVLMVKNLPANAGDAGEQVQSLSQKDPQSRKQQPTPYSCLTNPMDRGAWWAVVHGVAQSQTHRSRHSCRIGELGQIKSPHAVDHFLFPPFIN